MSVGGTARLLPKSVAGLEMVATRDKGGAAEARRAPACSWRWNTGVRRASAGLWGDRFGAGPQSLSAMSVLINRGWLDSLT